ncbi:MAG: thioredoxin family protein [Desulfovibrio sp.]|jgi:thioredoxin 1|nr:thioredoxin family protein [Desulfovibrio sp.]
MMMDISESSFGMVEKAGLVLVEFYTRRCRFCKKLGYILREIDREDASMMIYTIDFQESEELRNEFKVDVSPTILFFKEGQVVDRIEGLKQKL